MCFCFLLAPQLLCSKFKTKEVGVMISFAASTSCRLQTGFTRNGFSFTSFTVSNLRRPAWCRKKEKFECMIPAKIVIQVKMKGRSLTWKPYWRLSDVCCFNSSLILIWFISVASTIYCMVWKFLGQESKSKENTN